MYDLIRLPIDWTMPNNEAEIETKNKTILRILTTQPKDLTIILELFQYNSNAFRFLMRLWPEKKKRNNISHPLPNVKDIKRFKTEFANEISKLKEEKYITQCQELIKYFN